ncbi:MAG: response regulator transcription factor [Anaerolineales bacterium]|nr:response regulator transcription factor [Anaerolineales bacterium]
MNQQAHILIVDDDASFQNYAESVLEMAGFAVLKAENGRTALQLLEDRRVDLILSDIAMPQMNGYQLLGAILAEPAWAHLPFIFLSNRDLDSDIRFGKELGADDYLPKTAAPDDVLASVRGKLRRAHSRRQLAAPPERPLPPTATPDIIHVGQLTVDLPRHRAWLREAELALSAREFVLLAHMAQHSEQVVTPGDLVCATHELETDDVEAGSLIRPLIRTLRRKLGYPPGETGCIENVRGVGYRLLPPH